MRKIREMKVNPEEVGLDPQISAAPGKLAAVGSMHGDVAGGPDVLLRKRRVR
jgi:hypothetical protein